MSKFLLLPVTVIAFNFLACGGSGGNSIPTLTFPAAASGILDQATADELKNALTVNYTVEDNMEIFHYMPKNRASSSDDTACKVQISRGSIKDADIDDIPEDVAGTSECKYSDSGISTTIFDLQDANDSDWKSGYNQKITSSWTNTKAKDEEVKTESDNFQVSLQKKSSNYFMDYRYSEQRIRANGQSSIQPYAVFIQTDVSPVEKTATLDDKDYQSLRVSGSFSNLKGFFQYETKAKKTLVLALSASNLTYEDGLYKTGQIMMTDTDGNQLTIDFNGSTKQIAFVKK